MAASQSSGSGASFRFQRMFAGFEGGMSALVKTKRAEGVRFFMRQDAISGSCGLMCVGMCLIALGVIKVSAFENAPRRRYGLVSDIWSLLKDSFFTGVEVTDLHARLQQLDVPVRFTCQTGSAQKIDEFAITSLSTGDLTILAYENLSNRHKHYRHYVLGCGVSGLSCKRQNIVDSLLVIDSCGDELLTPYNGMLRRLPNGVRGKKLSPNRWYYESANHVGLEKVVLIGAIRCRLR
jgi:hypothetical protein